VSAPKEERVSIQFDDIETFRRNAREQAASWPRVLAHLPSGTNERITLPVGAPAAELMLYRPTGLATTPGVFVNLHGGGFVMGDWESDDPFCRFLADTAGCAVVNLDYVLAPEHKFPAAVEQTYALLVWLAEHGAVLGVDGSRLAVGGHSAGGNLSAAACLLAKERGGPALRGQIIDYAPLDLATLPSEKDTGPLELPPEITDLDTEMGALYNAWYLAVPEDAGSPLASPVLAEDLAGLPPALVITAGKDLLRGEGDRYAERLAAAGVETEHAVFEGSFHAFTHFGPEHQAAAAWQRMATFLARVLA